MKSQAEHANAWRTMGMGGVWGRDHERVLRRMQDDCALLGRHIGDDDLMKLLAAVATLSRVTGDSWEHCWDQMRTAMATILARG